MPAAPHCECNERIALAEATRHLTSPTLARFPPPPKRMPQACVTPRMLRLGCASRARAAHLRLRAVAAVPRAPVAAVDLLLLLPLLFFNLLLPPTLIARRCSSHHAIRKYNTFLPPPRRSVRATYRVNEVTTAGQTRVPDLIERRVPQAIERNERI